MSLFSEQLRVALDAADMSQSDISQLTKISQPTISRYLKGDIRPEPEAFGALLDSLPETLHFELIVARLADELPKKYRDTVNILAHGAGRVREDQAPYMPKNMAKDLRRAVEHLAAEAIQVPAVRDLVLSLARALGEGQTDLEAGGSSERDAVDEAVDDEGKRRNQAKRDRKSS